MAGKAAQPSSIPMRPTRSRCTFPGPSGTWIRDPTKKAADMRPVETRRLSFKLRNPMAMPAQAKTAPAVRTSGERTPSEMCMYAPGRGTELTAHLFACDEC